MSKTLQSTIQAFHAGSVGVPLVQNKRVGKGHLSTWSSRPVKIRLRPTRTHAILGARGGSFAHTETER